jgi:hypothetical protein
MVLGREKCAVRDFWERERSMRGWGGWLCEWVYFLLKKKKKKT